MSVGIYLAEHGVVPDSLTRRGVRSLLRARLSEPRGAREGFVQQLRQSPIAIQTQAANEQHYEVPAAFFQFVLGRHRKYSSCLWEPGTTDLDAAEAAMLRLTCERAGLADGMRILELGCGWGSLSLWMAEHYRNSTILAVSNSHSQREYIESVRDARGLDNLSVHTADMNLFRVRRRFDRVVSVEMFEHMRNYEQLMRRVAGWLEEDGRLFFHVFCHRDHAYPFETEGADNWMGRYFFTGGLMPSEDLFREFDDDLVEERQWRVGGEHYARTAEAWLRNLDEGRNEVLSVLRTTYGSAARRWLHRWRIFFMACAELFGYSGGDEWFISHNLYRRKS